LRAVLIVTSAAGLAACSASPPKTSNVATTGTPGATTPAADATLTPPPTTGTSSAPPRTTTTTQGGGGRTTTTARTTTTTTTTSKSSPPPANEPPHLVAGIGFVNGTFKCHGDGIRITATADDPDGIDKVLGSFRNDRGPGDSISSPPSPMRLQSGVYKYGDVDIEPGTFTFVVTAYDKTGLTRTATTFIIFKSNGSGGCDPINSPMWVLTP
jgi:hypothetical protein